VSQSLTGEQCRKLLAAADKAERKGLRFNRTWTIHYQRAGISEQAAAAFIGYLLKRLAELAKRSGGQFAAIWVRENGAGKGGHVHLLLHLPPGITLRGRIPKWIKLAGGRCIAGVSVVHSIGGRLSAAESGGEHYDLNAGNARRYLLKAAPADVGRALGLKRYGEAGFIVGKRCGRTQNLS
jgi:hypothetical protein